MPNQPCEIITVICKYIVAPTIGAITAIFIYKLGRRHKTIKEFRSIFLDEKYKITTSKAVQDFGLQENAIVKLNGIVKADDITTIKALWEDYKKTENQCRQAIPSPGTIVIHYGEHKPKILSKIDKIINYLKQ